MEAQRLRVALVRKNGMPLDYAREAAVEAGYLHPDSDINDLLNAINEELHGRKVYRLGEAGAAEMARLWETRAGRQDRRMLESEWRPESLHIPVS